MPDACIRYMPSLARRLRTTTAFKPSSSKASATSQTPQELSNITGNRSLVAEAIGMGVLSALSSALQPILSTPRAYINSTLIRGYQLDRRTQITTPANFPPFHVLLAFAYTHILNTAFHHRAGQAVRGVQDIRLLAFAAFASGSEGLGAV